MKTAKKYKEMTVDEAVEEWRPVRDFEDTYEVSDMGRIRSKRRKGSAGGVMLPKSGKNGYIEVRLYRDGKAVKREYLHRLVAQSFMPNFRLSMQVDHFNGDRMDNRIENLQAGTAAENSRGHRDCSKGTSRFRGVCFESFTGRYKATIKKGGKTYRMGRFDSEIEAAKAYNAKAKELGFKDSALNEISPDRRNWQTAGKQI